MNRLLIQALCSVSLDALKDKLRITPVGEIKGIDGRYFNVDGKAFLKDLKKMH
ncbi:hypothetical protein [Abyssogena phaseoliformis symbiont]|uniref:hypothetical protein n=1 Tax=Abyssogena phaseoliformis symbiont TaxID=596095 RepID=UPI001915B81F|nr:hypothetical protein [Abyssogena phaseoliformis symbiont]MBW5289455.1 hypothetical protein [Candidatus Ruthia sp. Apha_13_S6]